MRIAFATSEETIHLTDQDRVLAGNFRDRGVEVTPVIWSDTNWHMQDFHAIIIRSCWDYHLQVNRFLQWVKTVSTLKIPLFNQAPLIQWNYHKSYLQDLSEQGVTIIPTRWYRAEDRPAIAAVMDELEAPEIVIKPAVGATAYKTIKLDAESVGSFNWDGPQPYPQGFLIQKFMKEIESAGEWSHIFFSGKYSHSVIKQAREGDFRVQSNFGGKSKLQTPEHQLVIQAGEILNLVDPMPLYARIDGLHIAGTFYLMELELIEPELYLSNDELAARFVDAFMNYDK